MAINYLQGDATNPVGNDHRVIVHICNNLGKWGKGFVLAISKHWSAPEKVYRESFKHEPKPSLGNVQLVPVEDLITVANIIGQSGIRSPNDKTAPPPIRYNAIEQGLSAIANYVLENNASIHMPRIGCGLAGGDWEEIEPIIERTLATKGIKVFVYDF